MRASLTIWHYLLFCMFVNAFVQDGSSARVSCHEESYSHMVSSDLIAISIFWWYKLYSVPCPTINQYLHWVALTLPQTSKHQFSFVSKILLPYDQPYLDWVTLTLPYTPANIYWALCQVFSCPSINHTWIELLLLCLKPANINWAPRGGHFHINHNCQAAG